MSDVPRTDSPLRRLVESVAVAGSLLLGSFVAAPLPALNEPHYLAKAKHFWNPAWCAGDLFLESANAHTVFYATVGWLTLFLSLEAVAVIGRVTALTLLATGWTAFTRRLIPIPGAAFASTWVFLGLQAVGNWSGEWVVGGVESKVYAFGLLFWAATWALDGKPIAAAAALGLGIAFHPVVGLWTVLAVTFAALVGWAVTTTTSLEAVVGTAHSTKKTLAIAVVVLVVTALPGIIPVVRLLTADVDATTRYLGTYLQVFHRLAHHLDPMLFPRSAYLGYAAMSAVWIAGWWWRPRTPAWRWLDGTMAGALLFAVAGFAVGYGPRPPNLMPGYEWRMQLLKFYPFRLADALLPMVVAWLAIMVLSRLPWPRWGRRVALGVLIAGTLFRAHVLTMSERYQASQDADWIVACRWIRDHTPADAVFHTPHFRWTFKWYAERPEYATFKDCPQDVKSIVEWNRRLLLLTKRFQTGFADGVYTRDELHALHGETGITHLITDRLGPMDFPPIYQNGSFRVYDLRGSAKPD
jgi:hypothetical protein